MRRPTLLGSLTFQGSATCQSNNLYARLSSHTVRNMLSVSDKSLVMQDIHSYTWLLLRLFYKRPPLKLLEEQGNKDVVLQSVQEMHHGNR